MLRREVLSLATALVSLLPGLAIAQDNTTPPPAPPPAAETAAPAAAPAASAEGDQSKEKTEEIVVTGSRVRRKDLNTPAPVTVISKETIQASGKVSIGDFLQTLPEQGNAINTAVNNGGDGATRVSLRGIGSARTLVLINGRRMVPGGAGADASVDLNSIPTAAIERVEILKDGASAIYGSDAIAGVVNLITRKKWSGTEFSAFGGVSGHSDAATTDLSITTGTSGDRGNLMFSAGFYDQQRAMAGDRSFSKFQYFYDATGDNNAAGIVGQYASGSSRVPGGRISATGTGDAAFTALQNGWFPDPAKPPSGFFMHDSSIPASDPHIAGCLGAGRSLSDCQWRPMITTNTAGLGGDLYNFAPINYLVTPQRRVSLFSTGDTNFGSLARGFFEASYVNRQSKQQLAPEPLIIGAGGVTDPGGNLVAISANNMYNPFGKAFTSSSRRLDEFGPRTHDEDIDTIRVVGGLDGTLGEQLGLFKGWAWDASLNYGRTSGTFIIGGSLMSSRVADALGPSTLVNGKPACVRDINNPAATVIAGCVPLDLFHGSGSITQDQVAPLIFTGTSRGTNAMTAVNANVSGELFSLFADRPVGLAVGYEYRNLSGSFTNDPLTAKFDSSNGGSFDTRGSYQANEGYAELSVPILSGMPLVSNLEASAAVRVFHYSNFGNDSTYKFGARYSPIRDVTLRGTYSTAFRAPSIPDLFSGQFDNFPNVHDPCATAAPGTTVGNRCGIAANNGDDSTQLRSRNGGNPDLKPETAKIYTVGVVYEPSFLRNFSATLDYYNVDVNKAITTIGESTILAGCYTTGAQPQYCDLVIRDPISHQVTLINNLNQNVGEETVAGIDLALRYTQPTAAFGRFGFTFDGTWLQKHNQVLADGTVVKGKGTFDLQQNTGQGGTNAPYKFRAGVVWGLGGLGAGAAMKYISGFHECGDSGGDFSGGGLCYVDPTFQRSVDAYQTYDLFVSYALASGIGRSSVAVGVNNVFDTNPVKIYNGFASATDQYNYDQIGRFFYVRLTHNY